MQLGGKVALITGGASGIGRATALLFAREGAAVSVVDLDQAGGEAVVQAIIGPVAALGTTGPIAALRTNPVAAPGTGAGGQAIFVRCDVTQASDCQRAVRETVAAFGGIDILFNNAGIIRRTTVLDTSEEEWDRVMAVNVKSIYLLSREAIPIMAKAGGGSIINTASGWGLVGGRNAVSYCASKGAVVNMTRAMALDHGADKIRVNALCPGDTDTALLRDEARQLGEPEARFLAAAADRPLARVGQPEEIAQAALYLASDASSFVTGATLVVDGGGLAG